MATQTQTAPARTAHRLPAAITTEAELQALVDWCVGTIGLGYHPDTPAAEYEPAFDAETAARLDALHEQAFERFGDRIYSLGVDAFQAINSEPEPAERTYEAERLHRCRVEAQLRHADAELIRLRNRERDLREQIEVVIAELEGDCGGIVPALRCAKALKAAIYSLQLIDAMSGKGVA